MSRTESLQQSPVDTARTVVRARGGRERGGRTRGGRAREWLGRYAPAEAAATLGAVLAASVAGWFGVPAATAYAGAIGEAVAFYAVLFIRDQRRWIRCTGGRAPWRTLRDLLMEFGPAELLDTFAVRPLAMYVGVVFVGDMVTGVLLGKVAADVVFYTLAIIGYEVRRPVTIPGPIVAKSAGTGKGRWPWSR